MLDQKVSIIVPIYNAQLYLSDCIDSILKQDHVNIEVVLVNDGSKDNSDEICKAYEKLDDRVRYIKQKNSGVSVARNTGLANASGSYIMFVDSDDKLQTSSVSNMMREAEFYNADLVIGSYEIEYEEFTKPVLIDTERIVGKRGIADYFAKHFLEAIASSVWGKLYRKEFIISGFEGGITMGEDLLFNLEYIKNVSSIAAIRDPVYVYNQTNVNSLVKNYKQLYYDNDKLVCLRWIDWAKNCGGSEPLVDLFYRISRSFFAYVLFVSLKYDKQQAKAQLNSVIDADLINAIKVSLGKYNFIQKAILRAAGEQKIDQLYLLAKGYAKLKLLLKGK